MEYNEDVHFEVQCLATEYSPIRMGYSKWRTFKYKNDTPPESKIRVETVSNEKYFLIYSSVTQTTEGIPSVNIEKRIAIKQNKLLYNSVKSLWDMINPFHLQGISKKVYIRLYTFIYLHYLNCVSEAGQAEEYASKDSLIDFNGENSLDFVGFYLGLFECVDRFTKSTLVNEYSRFLNTLQDKLEDCFWFNGLDLHNRLHIKSCSTSCAPQSAKSNRSKHVNLFNIRNSIKISDRLLYVPEHIIDKSENKILEKRMNRLSRMQSVPIKYIVLNRSLQSPERSKKSRPSTREKPQPKKNMRYRRNSNILEDIIENRKHKVFNKTQEIFF